MDKLISAFGGNLHIVRRIVSGLVVFGFVALFVATNSKIFESNQFWENLNSNNALVATTVVLSAYLVGSIVEYFAHSSFTFLSSVLAQSFAYPMHKFGWLPNPFRFLCILLWWVFASYFTVYWFVARRVMGRRPYRLDVERHLDGPGKTLLRSLSSAVRFGLVYPASLHFDHAVEDLMVRSGNRRPAMEYVLAKQSDATAIFGSLLAGLVLFASLSIAAVAFYAETETEPDFSPAAEFVAPVTDPSVEKPDGTEDDDWPEPPVVVIEEDTGFFPDFGVASLNILAVLLSLPVMGLFSYVFLQFRKTLVVTLIETAASEKTAIETVPPLSAIDDVMYRKRKPSKAQRFLRSVFWLSVLICLPIELFQWVFGKYGILDSSFWEEQGGIWVWLGRIFEDPVFWRVVNRLKWAILPAIAVFVFIRVFLAKSRRESFTRRRALEASLLFFLGYGVIQSVFVSIEVMEVYGERGDVFKSLVSGLRTALAFAVGGVVVWCLTFRQVGLKEIFPHLRVFGRRIILSIVAMLVVNFALRLIAKGIGNLMNSIGPTQDFLPFGMIVQEVGYVLAAVVGICVGFKYMPTAIRRAAMWRYLGWFAFAIWIFVGFDYSMLAGGLGDFRLSGLNIHIGGLNIPLGWYFVNALGALLVVRVFQTAARHQQLNE